MSYSLLKIRLERFSKAPPEINVWNIFDSEHPPYIHSKRKNGEGMDPSYILFETSDMNVTLDTQRLPILSFLRYRSVMVHLATPDNSVIQYSSFLGVPTVQKYSAIPQDTGSTKYVIEIVFYLTGLWKLLSPVIKRYVTYWLSQTWNEDLPLKERRQRFLNLGFIDMKGLPGKLSERNGQTQKFKLPLPRAKNDVESHPFHFRNLDQILG